MVGKIIDKEKFLEEHRQRVLHSIPKIGNSYKARLEEYAYENKLKLCQNCYRTYEGHCQECS